MCCVARKSMRESEADVDSAVKLDTTLVLTNKLVVVYTVSLL